MKIKIKFYKYHGCGNDFIIIDEIEKQLIPEELRGKVSSIVCKRRFSIGADDVLYLVPSHKTDAQMRIFEPDGTEADMCGNGIRCAAKYLCEKTGKNQVKIETRAGVKLIEKIGEEFKVNMGQLLKNYGELKEFVKMNFKEDEELIDKQIKFPLIGEIKVSIVSTGEPHIIIFVEDVEKEDIEKYAKAIARNRQIFPKGITVNLVQILNEKHLKIRTYERGVWGETLACGTGATASAAVAYLLNKVKEKEVYIEARGGKLKIIIDKNLYMIGPAQKVYNGEITLNI